MQKYYFVSHKEVETMGLFHKTLGDISEKAQAGKFIEAKALLDKHIKAEHHFQSDLAGLQGALNAFSHELRELQDESSAYIKEKIPLPDSLKKMFKTRIYNARINLSRVEALIVRLRKDRLDLR